MRTTLRAMASQAPFGKSRRIQPPDRTIRSDSPGIDRRRIACGNTSRNQILSNRPEIYPPFLDRVAAIGDRA